MTSFKVYIAGAISDPNTINVLRNLGKGITESVRLLEKGYVVFSPFIDFQFFLHPEGDISLEQIQAYSIEWLKCCDAVYVMPDSDGSMGVQKEKDVAYAHHIPVVYTEEDLLCLREKKLGIHQEG